PALPPIRRLIVRDGRLRGPVASLGASATSEPRMLDVEILNLTAGPLAPGRHGHLDATFTLKGEQPKFSMPGRAEAEIALAEPLTEVRLEPLHLRLGAAAGGQGLPIQLDTEAVIALPTGRVLLDPFALLADGPRIDGTAEFYPTPAGLAMDAQMRVPPFDLRGWLLERTAIALPGAADGLSQVGGQFELSLRGTELTIDDGVLTLARTPVKALARLRLTPAAPALELETSADVYGGRLEARLDASQLSAGAAPVVRLAASASAVDLAALLTDLRLGGRAQAALTGLAEIELDLVGRGADPQAIIDSLGGDVALVVRDGALTMVDLGQLIADTVGALGVSREETEDLTRFSVLSLTAKGADGHFHSEDIRLRSNLLAIDGNGRLELPTQRIALDLQAVMTKPPKGRGIKELEGIPIPIAAKGSWADPRWEVDVKSALDQAARRALREDSDLLDQLEERTGIEGLGEGLRQVLPGLLGQ
ncbi:MAG: AsmA-like C-terminal region-containing protein, partial [Halochromatium sp.]